VSDDAIFRKCARRLIPFMALLFVINLIDRVNVGFAALTMNKDLNLSAGTFGLAAGIFFLGYAALQIPANAIVERVGARRSVFCILLAWGAVSASTAFVQGPSSFYALRFLLGIAEAGFFPGMIFYLGLWFPQAYRARFTALFMCANPASVVIGGPLSSLILGMDGLLGLHGWQWLFLIEALPACALALAVPWLLPDGPEKAPWLGAAERDAIAARLGADQIGLKRDLVSALTDVRVFAVALANAGTQIGLYGTTLWLPQIVQATGFSIRATGFVVAVPYVLSMGAMVLWGRRSDVKHERIRHIAFPAFLSAAAFAMASVAQSNLVLLASIGFALIALFVIIPLMYSLVSSFLRGAAAAGAIALVNVGSVGGFLGPTLMGALKAENGNYAPGLVAMALALAFCGAITLVLGRAIAPRVVAESA